jgi:hypothetical protein
MRRLLWAVMICSAVYSQPAVQTGKPSFLTGWALLDSITVTGAVRIGGIAFPAADGTSGQVLTTNGAGVTSWTSAGSGGIGDITGVTAGTNITGGGASGSVTVNADTATGTTKLATQGFVARNVADSLAKYTTAFKLDTTKIDTSQYGKFVRDHIGGVSNIAPGAIVNADVNASAAIVGSKLASHSITYVQLDTMATGLVDIRKYGATGDGVTDDYAAFNAVVSMVNAGDSLSVYIPPGKYRFSNYLHFTKGNIIFRGAGEQTILIPDDGITTLFLLRQSNTDSSWESPVGIGSFELRDLRIDASKTTGNPAPYLAWVYLYNASRVVIDNVFFSPLKKHTAIYFDNCNNILINNCYFAGMEENAGALNCVNILDSKGVDKVVQFKKGKVSVTNNAWDGWKHFALMVIGQLLPDVSITGNKFRNGKVYYPGGTYGHAIALESDDDTTGPLNNVSITTNQIDSCDTGIYVQAQTTAVCSNIDVSHNNIDNAIYGIKLMGGEIKCESNILTNIRKNGILLYQMNNYIYRNNRNAIISGNIIKGKKDSLITSGIYLYEPHYVNICANTISNFDSSDSHNDGNGIYVFGRAYGLNIISNIVHDIYGGGIVLRSNNNVGDSTWFDQINISKNIITDVSSDLESNTLGFHSGISFEELTNSVCDGNIIIDNDSSNLEHGITQGGYRVSGIFFTKNTRIINNIVRGASVPYFKTSAYFTNDSTLTFFNNSWSSVDLPDVYKLTYNGNPGFYKGITIGRSYMGITPPTDGLIVKGSAGIGTSSNAGYRLNVSGQSNFSGTMWFTGNYGTAKDVDTGSLFWMPGSNSSTNPSIKAYGKDYSGGDFYKGVVDIVYGGNPDGTPGNLPSLFRIIYKDDAGTDAERLRIISTGLVGIGTTNPTSKLHVSGGGVKADSSTVGAGGVWMRNFYYAAADSSLRIVFYNATLSRIDTVECPQAKP